MCAVCWFLWGKYSHQGQFEVTSVLNWPAKFLTICQAAPYELLRASSQVPWQVNCWRQDFGNCSGRHEVRKQYSRFCELPFYLNDLQFQKCARSDQSWVGVQVFRNNRGFLIKELWGKVASWDDLCLTVPWNRARFHGNMPFWHQA